MFVEFKALTPRVRSCHFQLEQLKRKTITRVNIDLHIDFLLVRSKISAVTEKHYRLKPRLPMLSSIACKARFGKNVGGISVAHPPIGCWLNLGAIQNFRSYWKTLPAKASAPAHAPRLERLLLVPTILVGVVA